ncbi:MAG: IS4 family transposase [bacterium]
MNVNKTIFSQLMDYLPIKAFRHCVRKYNGNHKVKTFSCLDQFYTMAFAQLTFRESLRDIEACLRSQRSKLYHMGFRSIVARNTLSNANEKRDWRIYAEFAQIVIHQARELYRDEEFGIELENTVYALDSTTIDLCLSLFPWAIFRKRKGAIKLHTVLDLRGNIPTFVRITDGKFHDVNILDILIPEAGSIYLLDRAYIDYARLYALHLYGAFFIIRAKSNLNFTRLYSRSVIKSLGLKCDQTIVLSNYYAAKDYPDKLRRVKFYDSENNKNLVFLSNIFTLPALSIAELYKYRWKIELFFKWIKQNLRIKAFYGTSENAVKTQIWIAITIYVLVAIIKKQLKLDISLYTFLQILSVNMFEKVPILQLVTDYDYRNNKEHFCKQLNLFD